MNPGRFLQANVNIRAVLEPSAQPLLSLTR